ILSPEFYVPSPAAPGKTACRPSEHTFEKIRKIVIAEIPRILSVRSALLLLLLCPIFFELLRMLPVLSVLIVLFALFRISQDFIGFVGLLKIVFRSLIVGVYIRMIFPCQFAISLFNIVLGGILCHTKYFIIILIFHEMTVYVKLTCFSRKDSKWPLQSAIFSDKAIG